jgi:hypothetical protein
MTAIVLDTPEKIARFRLLALRGALRLEIAGMKKRGQSAYQILKNEGYTGTRAQVLEQLHNHLEATKGETMTDKPKTMAELEAENSDGFRNPSRTSEQQAEIDRRTKAMREHDRLHTAIEKDQPETDE